VQDMYWVVCIVYRGRHYENNVIFPKMRADRPRLQDLCCRDLRSVGRPTTADWLAGCSSALARVSQSDWSLRVVFTNVGR